MDPLLGLFKKDNFASMFYNLRYVNIPKEQSNKIDNSLIEIK